MRLDQIRREADKRAERAERVNVEISVDDKRKVFSLARDESGYWCAAAAVDKGRITVASERIDPASLSLVTIADPVGYFGA